ncbi:MAG: glycosyltransferase family 39 protein [candidate division WOR-3 bacterium]|nr:MAG: glycosyltransferase family 39 protein [candidate division WOR-3 bacterium]
MLFVALLLRVLFVVFSRDPLYTQRGPGLLASEVDYLKKGIHPSDSQEFLGLARGLNSGVFGWDGKPNTFRTPAYPVLLFVCARRIPLVLAAQIVLSVSSVLLAWAVARRMFGVRAALAAGAFMAVDVPSVLFAGVIMAETLLVFAMMLACWLFVLRRTFWAGLVLGGATLVKPVAVLAFLPLAVVLLSRRNWRQAILLVACSLALPGVWVGRNLLRHGRPGLTSIAGFNLYYSNAARLEQVRSGKSGSAVRRALAARAGAIESDNPLAVSSELSSMATARILADPVRYAAVHAKGMVPILFGVKSDDAVSRIWGTEHGYLGEKWRGESKDGPATAVLAWFELLLTGAAAVLAVASMLRRHQRGVKAMLLSLFLYYVVLASPVTDGRMRVPGTPFLYIAAASILASGISPGARSKPQSASAGPAGCTTSVPTV